MQLSIGHLYEALSEQFTLFAFDTRRDYPMELKNAALLTGAPPEPGILYVAEARRLPVRWKFSTHTALVIVGAISEGYFDNCDVDYLCVKDNRFPVVFNAVQSVFSRYQAFDAAMKETLIQNAPPEQLCDIIAAFLGAPLIVFDDSLRIRYCSDDASGLLEWETDAYSGRNVLPTEFLNQLNLVYMETAENFINGAVLLRDDRLPHNLICTLDGKNDYILTVFETEKILTRNTLQIVSYCNDFILRSFEDSMGKSPASNCLASLISSMLGGTKYSTMDLENQLASVGWKTNDSCCCFVVLERYPHPNSTYLNTFCLKVESQFKACVSFLYNDKAVVVVNLDKSDCKPRDIPNRIGILIREGLLKAGISFKYWNFETTPIYYQQACSAYEMGALYNPSTWCYLFEDYALRYFMHYGSSRLPPRHLCHPALVELHRYDEANGTALRPTLEAYVRNNCNAVIAANKLFIHRNTFYQRLAKIQEILNLNLDNADVRLYLQMSTFLISMYYYELENGFNFPRE